MNRFPNDARLVPAYPVSLVSSLLRRAFQALACRVAGWGFLLGTAGHAQSMDHGLSYRNDHSVIA